MIDLTAPPSACRNIYVQQKTDTQLIIRWTKPENTGRKEFYYQIQYSNGDATGQHSLVDRTDYVQEVISSLKTNTEYTITVTVHNTVSDQDIRNEHLRRCELTASTEEGSKFLMISQIIVYSSLLIFSSIQYHLNQLVFKVSVQWLDGRYHNILMGRSSAMM